MSFVLQVVAPYAITTIGRWVFGLSQDMCVSRESKNVSSLFLIISLVLILIFLSQFSVSVIDTWPHLTRKINEH